MSVFATENNIIRNEIKAYSKRKLTAGNRRINVNG